MTEPLRRLLLLPSLLIPLLGALVSCDEPSGSVGGLPGGNPDGQWDSLLVAYGSVYHAEQQMKFSDLQFVGRLDAQGLEARMVIHVEYLLPGTITLIPDTVSVDSVYLALRMDRDSSRVFFGSDWGAGLADELPVDLLLITDPADGSEVQDSLYWDVLYGNGAGPQVLDSLRLSFKQNEMLWGDKDGVLNSDPTAGVRSFKSLAGHEWWFTTDSLATAVPGSSPVRYRRTLLLTVPEDQQGMLAFLGYGWENTLKPGYRLYFQDYYIDDPEQGLQDSTNWAFQPSAWQNTVFRESPSGTGLSLSSGPSSQVLLRLPPFQPTDGGVPLDPSTVSLLKAYLRLPVLDHSYNSDGGTVYLYGMNDYPVDGVDLNEARFDYSRYSAEVVEQDSSELEFSLVNMLVHFWTGRNDFSPDDSMTVALRFNGSDLELRKLLLVDPALADSLKPRLVYKWTESPSPWRADR
jgi:hypothetical protein